MMIESNDIFSPLINRSLIGTMWKMGNGIHGILDTHTHTWMCTHTADPKKLGKGYMIMIICIFFQFISQSSKIKIWATVRVIQMVLVQFPNHPIA